MAQSFGPRDSDVRTFLDRLREASCDDLKGAGHGDAALELLDRLGMVSEAEEAGLSRALADAQAEVTDIVEGRCPAVAANTLELMVGAVLLGRPVTWRLS